MSVTVAAWAMLAIDDATTAAVSSVDHFETQNLMVETPLCFFVAATMINVALITIATIILFNKPLKYCGKRELMRNRVECRPG